MLNAHELDGKGILSLEYETEEHYRWRGNAILQAAAHTDDAILMHLLRNASLKNTLNIPMDIFTYSTDPLFDCWHANRAAALHDMQELYSMDLSWVRFFQMATTLKAGTRLWGYMLPVPLGRVYMPVVAIQYASRQTMLHELIHAGRFAIFCRDYKISYVQDEEIVAKNIFQEFDSLDVLFCYGKFEKAMREAVLKLKRCFGDKAGYVFIRLTSEEITKLGSAWFTSPRKMIKDGTRHNLCPSYLRFKIMAEKLGL